MSKAVVRKLQYVNNVTFPQELRDVIPEHKPSAGRCLKLESLDAQGSHTVEWGRRVQMKLHVCETGKLSGAFDIWVDLQLDAAKGLVDTLKAAVDQSEKSAPVKTWPTT